MLEELWASDYYYYKSLEYELRVYNADKVDKEIERLKEIEIDYNKHIRKTGWALGHKAEEIERLKEDLKKYGRHDEICEAKWKHRGGIQAKCTCGLQQALKGE